MAEQQTIDNIKKIVQDSLGLKEEEVTPLTGSSSLTEDLNIDSLDTLEVLMAIETEYDITIEDEEAKKMNTIEDLAKFIEKNKK